MAQEKQNRLKRWWTSLSEKHHLTIINEESYAELYSRRTSKGKFLTVLILFLVASFVLCFLIISFTPIKKIVPGFESDEMHQQLVDMQLKLSVLEKEIEGKISYGNSLDSILSGTDITVAELDEPTQDKTKKAAEEPQKVDVKTTSLPKASTKKANKPKNEVHSKMSYRDYHFFNPVKGIVSQGFKPSEKHYGIDVVTEKNEPVKATLSGTVISTNWTLNEGNLIAVQHDGQLISFYKHNSVVLKKTGDVVNAGDVIAIVGNSGELTSGPHLHFEIWKEGVPIDPSELMTFK